MARALAHLLTLLVVGCGSDAPAPPAPASRKPTSTIPQPTDPISAGRLFVDSREYRRAALERSVVQPSNMYSALRLAEYATVDSAWEALPVWEPTVTEHRVGGRGPKWRDWSVEWTHEGLMRAGARAFSTYPMRVDGRLEPLRKIEVETAGFWVDDAGRIGGLVQMDDGLAWTCATCHSTPDGPGRPNAAIDMAQLYRLGDREPGPASTWRPGTIDPSRDRTNNPSVVGDLRALRYQSHLHWTATLRNSLEAAAVRIDTLFIVSNNGKTRPPHALSYALAYYLWQLGGEPGDEKSELFETNCGTCHHADATVGRPLPWVVDDQPGRGTGYHRVPSLYGVADRGRLLHDGSVGSLEELLEAGPAWHKYGRRLTLEDREELVGYIKRQFRASEGATGR